MKPKKEFIAMQRIVNVLEAFDRKTRKDMLEWINRYALRRKK